MIHLFKRKRKLLIFPTVWANSVSNWCLGVCSPKGTIVIDNTASPTDGGQSLKLDINETRIETLINKHLKNRTSFTTSERKAILNIIGASVDNKYITWRDFVLSIDTDTLIKELNIPTLSDPEEKDGDDLKAFAPQEDVIPTLDDTTETDASMRARVGTSDMAAREDHKHPVCYEQGTTPLFRNPAVSPTVYTSTMPSDTIPSSFPLKTDSWQLGAQGSSGFNILVVSRIEEDEDEGVHYLFFREAKVSRNGNFVSVGSELGATAILA